MGNILLTRKPTSARFFLVWSLGLGMLLAPLADSLALPPKPDPGKIYCECRCSAGAWVNKDLSWEKKAHCNLNGRSCKIKGADGKWHAGKLLNCVECIGQKDGGYLCLPVGAGPPGDIILDPPDVQLEHPPAPGRPPIR
jgi:hypothetical protein